GGKVDRATVLFETRTGGSSICWQDDGLYFAGDSYLSRYDFLQLPFSISDEDNLFDLFFGTGPANGAKRNSTAPDNEWLYRWYMRTAARVTRSAQMTLIGNIVPLRIDDCRALRKGPDGRLHFIGNGSTSNSIQFASDSPIKAPEAGQM